MTVPADAPVFRSLAAARAAGYRPCGTLRGGGWVRVAHPERGAAACQLSAAEQRRWHDRMLGVTLWRYEHSPAERLALLGAHVRAQGKEFIPCSLA